jgi:hypothetical protein
LKKPNSTIWKPNHESEAGKFGTQALMPQLRWTPEAELVLFQAMVDQVRLGKRAQSGFKPEAWVYAQGEVKEHMQDLGSESEAAKVMLDRVKNKVNDTKARYKEWINLASASGFGWNELTELYEATDKVWTGYIKVREAPKLTASWYYIPKYILV